MVLQGTADLMSYNLFYFNTSNVMVLPKVNQQMALMNRFQYI